MAGLQAGMSVASANLVASNWSEHRTPDGRQYFYNKITKQSTWQKPDALRTPEELSLQWREYATDSGRKYYFNVNTKQKVWEMPKEFKAFLERQGKSEMPSLAPVSLSLTAPPPPPPPSSSSKSTEQIDESEDALTPEAAFFRLLRDNDVNSGWSWDQLTRVVGGHAAFRNIKTVAERKQLFRDYQEDRRRQEREERRRLVQEARDRFKALLRRNNVSIVARWRVVADRLRNEREFHALENDRDRETVFEEYLDDLAREEKEKLRELRRDGADKLKALFSKREPPLTPRTPWREAFAWLEKQPAFSDDETLRKLDRVDILIAFEDIIMDLEKQERDTRNAEHAARRRADRRRRDAFRSLLDELVANGRLSLDSDWEALLPVIRADERTRAMDQQTGGSTALELLLDRLSDEVAAIKRHCSTAKDVLRALNAPLPADAAALSALLQADARGASIPSELIARVHRELDEQERRRARRRARRFESLLRRSSSIGRGMTWEAARPLLQGRSAFEDMPDEASRIAVFEAFMADWERKRSDGRSDGSSSSSDDNDGEDGRRNRSRRSRDDRRSRDASPRRERGEEPEPGELAD